MTLLVQDNEDLIATNITYHLSRGIDHVIVTDNRSTDATRAIVERLATGGNITLLDEAGNDFRQAAWVTRMARCAADMGASWVIHGDADELWWPIEGDLKTTLERVPSEWGSLIVPRSN